MSDKTVNLGLPYMSESQAQKEVVYNEAINILEMLVQPCVISISNTPPASPSESNMYVIGTSPSGAWVGKAKNITAYVGGAWKFIMPKEGWRVWNTSDSKEYRFRSGNWLVS